MMVSPGVIYAIGLASAVGLGVVFRGRIRNLLRRLLLGFDVQKLLHAQDVAGLHSAVLYKRNETDAAVNCTRSNAAIALGQIGALDSLDVLVEALADRSDRVVQAASQAIGQIVFRCLRQPMQQLGPAFAGAILPSLAGVQAKVTAPLQAAFRTHREHLTLMALGMVAGPAATDFLESIVRSGASSGERQSALQNLLNTSDPRIVALLLRSLLDADPGMRALAAELMGNLRFPGAAAVIAPLLQDKVARVQSAAIEALKTLRDRQSVEPLIHCLQSQDADILEKVIAVLGALEDPRALEPVRALVVHARGSVRMAASAALSRLGEAKWNDIIRGVPQDYVRLGEVKDPRALDVLSPLLEAKERPVRLAAIRGLGELGDEAAGPALAGQLVDPHPETRAAVLEALGKVHHQPAATLMRGYLPDSDPAIRLAASRGLAALGETQWSRCVKGDAGDMTRLLRSDDPLLLDLLISARHEQAAVVALGKSKSPRALAALIEVAGDANHPHGLEAIEGLASIGDLQAVPVLISLLKESKDEKLSAAVRALRELGDRRAAGPLAALLERAAPKLAVEILAVLAGLRDGQVAPSVRPMLLRGDADVRRAAADTLAQLGEAHWRECMKGTPEDYVRIARSGRPGCAELLLDGFRDASVADPEGVMGALGVLGDERAIPLLRDALVKDDFRYPLAAARALAELGEGQWMPCIRGHDRVAQLTEFARAGLCQATRELIRLLSSRAEVRTAAARSLIQLASAPDDELKARWTDVFRLITRKHDDSHSDLGRSSDCSHSDHTDVGIGLAFPETHER